MKSTNRWIILMVSIIMNVCVGAAYAWSVFQRPLIDMFGFTTSAASLAFTINLALVPVAMIFAGRIQDQKGPQVVTRIGSIIFGAGIFLAGFTNSITVLYLTYGVLGGLGIGTVYSCTVANTVKWFPDKRGLAGGLTAAGFGSGAVFLAPLAASLIQQYNVLTTFKILGAAFFVIIGISSFFIKAPQAGWKPEGWEPAKTANANSINTNADLSTKEMLKTSNFYILWVMYTIGTISGLMIIGHASPIGQEQIGLTSQVAALAVSILALSNTSGRLFWGSVSDKIGRYNSIVVMYIVSAVCLMILNIATTFPLFIIGTFGIALSFGGFLGIMPSVTADNFGAKNLGVNYGVIFTAFGVAAVVGPRLAAVAKEASGGLYSRAYLIASILNIAGIACTLLIINKMKKEKAAHLKNLELKTAEDLA